MKNTSSYHIITKKRVFISFLILIGSIITIFFLFVNKPAENIISSKKSDLINTVNVNIEKIDKEYKAKDNSVLMEASYEKPVLEGSSTAIEKINSFYENAQKQFFQNNEKSIKEIFGQDLQITLEEFGQNEPYIEDITSEITYNKNGIISILQNGYSYSGGAHGISYRVPHTFSLETGQELILSNILKGDEQHIKNSIINAFDITLDSFEGAYENATDTIKKTAGLQTPFYLTNNEIVFYYIPYELAPYAAGFVEASIPYKQKNSFHFSLN